MSRMADHRVTVIMLNVQKTLPPPVDDEDEDAEGGDDDEFNSQDMDDFVAEDGGEDVEPPSTLKPQESQRPKKAKVGTSQCKDMRRC